MVQTIWAQEPVVRDTALLQLSLFPPIQLTSAESNVSGLRLGLFSMNHDVTGIDLGLINRTTASNWVWSA